MVCTAIWAHAEGPGLVLSHQCQFLVAFLFLPITPSFRSAETIMPKPESKCHVAIRWILE